MSKANKMTTEQILKNAAQWPASTYEGDTPLSTTELLAALVDRCPADAAIAALVEVIKAKGVVK